MKLNIKFFANLKETAQTTRLIVDLDGRHLTVKNLLAELVCQKPLLESYMKSVLVAANHESVFPGHFLTASEEIKLLPPAGGG